MSATNHQLTAMDLADAPEAWASAGFAVVHDTVLLGSTLLRLTGHGTDPDGGTGVLGWALDGVDGPVDSLQTCAPAPAWASDSPPHPNGIERIDHVVVRTGDQDRTLAAFQRAGLEVRRGRSTSSYGSPMRQSFLWAGDVIIELVGPDDGAASTDEPPSFFGLALVAADLDTTAAHLGELLSTPKDAVQQGRRIAGLRGATVGISVPIAVMSPHVRGG
ncbi:MAG: VOC family protein [Microthrixaceae bacterium]